MIHSNCVFVLGGTNDHIELIKQLKEFAFYVVLIDYFTAPPAAIWADKHLVVSTRDIKAIEKIIVTYKPIHIFSACVDSSLYALSECQSKFSYCTLFTNAQYKIISNKYQMKVWMRDNEICSGKFQLIDKKTALLDLPLSLPLVVKPTTGSSSKGVCLINNEEAWQEALNEVDNYAKDTPILVEEYINGTELSVDLIFLDGQAHIIMISEICKKSTFSSTITKNIYNRETENKWKNDIFNLAVKLGNKLQLNNSLMLLQCIANSEGISIVEFSLRIGGGSKHHLIQQVKNIDMIRVYIHMMLQETDSVRALIQQSEMLVDYAAVHYIYPSSSGILTELDIPEKSLNSAVFIYKNLGDMLLSTENSSNRIAGIFVCGNNTKELDDLSHSIQKKLHFSVMPNTQAVLSSLN